MSTDTTYNFDECTVEKASGCNLMKPAEFFAIPLDLRMKLVLNGKVKFVKDGRLISSRDALKRN